MTEIILAKYGEIALKGLNKSTFEAVLLKTVRRRLQGLDFELTKSQSTLYIKTSDAGQALERLEKIFGISTLCRAVSAEKDYDAIVRQTVESFGIQLKHAGTFKVEAKRADKTFPLNSPQICEKLGADLLMQFPNLTVDVKNPQVTVTVEIRDTHAFIHTQKIPGARGLPVGTGGHGMLMLSGGIDS
ncbi:MAG: THUMP domain-containing protein, partial [Oscillospiraceae bacterium]|nr:THUMP domain-containing protein [Oscillospiraceae bacterium]